MKILNAAQIKSVDQFTITNEPVASIDLMERAAMACVNYLVKRYKTGPFLVVCGMGNNGGDGLAITRLLLDQGLHCTAAVLHHSESFSADAQVNYDRLRKNSPNHLVDIRADEELQALHQDTHVVIDAIFGTGLNKAVTGLAADAIGLLNRSGATIISVDVPSGLFPYEPTEGVCIQSAMTLTFQTPKLALLLPQNKVPAFRVLDIGLSAAAIELEKTTHYYITAGDVAKLLKPRLKFSHKGNYGHALLLAGSRGKSGAAIIAALGCLRSGAGLLTVHSTLETLQSLSHILPEAMGDPDASLEMITELNKPEHFDAIGIGPGIGTHADTQTVLKKLLNYYNGRLVIDADGLNILSENKTWLNFLPPDTILTPHPGEFERLAGKHTDDFEKLKILKQFSMKHCVIVVLKGAHSVIAMPDGNLFFNSTGHAGMAKAGSGDGLTGIILGLLARGYNAPQAALIGTFVHGYAGDLYARKASKESMLISDLINQLPIAFKKIERLNGSFK